MDDGSDIDQAVLAPRWPRFPYPGLRPFQITVEADESLIFYGRDKHKDEIIGRLGKSHLVMVIGPSGCGKSSLIKAGVIPALEAGFLARAGERWRTCQMRPGRRPLAELARALAGIAAPDDDAKHDEATAELEELLRSGPSGLWLAVGRLRDSGALGGAGRGTERLLVLLDQFEEVFGPQIENKQDVDDFVRLLVRFFEKPHEDLYVVLTMRTGYIGDAANFVGLAELLNATMYLTPVLDNAELRDAVTLPATDYQGEVEPALVEALLADMGTGTQYDADHLPLLQHALLWLWLQAWPRSGAAEPPSYDGDPPPLPIRLTLADYRDNGGLKGILQRHAEDVLGAAVRGEPERLGRAAEVVFRRLTERDYGGRYRRTPATMEELSQLASCDQAALIEVLAPFTDPSASLLEFRPTTPAPDTMVDISHESLIRQWPRLRQWADDENDQRRDFAGLLRRARTWARSGAGQRNILLEDDLSWAQRWLEGLGVYGSSDDALSAWAERQVKDALPAWTEPFGGPVGAIRALCTRSEQVRDARQQEEQHQVEEAARQRELEGRLQAEAEKALADREAAKAQAALNEAKAQQVAAELAQQKAQSAAQRSRFGLYAVGALTVVAIAVGAYFLSEQRRKSAEQGMRNQEQLTLLADLYGVAVANRDLPIGTLPEARRAMLYQEVAVLLDNLEAPRALGGTTAYRMRLEALEGEGDRTARHVLARTVERYPVVAPVNQDRWLALVSECVFRADPGARRQVLKVGMVPLGATGSAATDDLQPVFAMLTLIDNRPQLETVRFDKTAVGHAFSPHFAPIFCRIGSDRTPLDVAAVGDATMDPQAHWLVERPRTSRGSVSATARLRRLDWFQICARPNETGTCAPNDRQWHVEVYDLGPNVDLQQDGLMPKAPADIPAVTPRFLDGETAAALARRVGSAIRSDRPTAYRRIGYRSRGTGGRCVILGCSALGECASGLQDPRLRVRPGRWPPRLCRDDPCAQRPRSCGLTRAHNLRGAGAVHTLSANIAL